MNPCQGCLLSSPGRLTLPYTISPVRYWENLASKWRLHIGELLHVALAQSRATKRMAILIFRLAGTTSYLLWNAKTIGSHSRGLLEPPALCAGMSELLAPNGVIPTESVGSFLTTSESLTLTIFSTSPWWLMPSATWGGAPELLAPNPQVRYNHYFPLVICQSSHKSGLYKYQR